MTSTIDRSAYVKMIVTNAIVRLAKLARRRGKLFIREASDIIFDLETRGGTNETKTIAAALSKSLNETATKEEFLPKIEKAIVALKSAIGIQADSSDPRFVAAIAWIAFNDAPGDDHSIAELEGLISVLLVADVFEKSPSVVAAKVYNLRLDIKKSEEEAKRLAATEFRRE